ncbi:MAG: succinyldiaminopimelate transaminase [Thiomargarita sp.]|nr:succinyldiaminopimelate transaminase [Thiomargarita sp.]
MNPKLQLLQAYPFQKLNQLFKNSTPPAKLNHINLSIGEPQHNPPIIITDAFQNAIIGLKKYPKTSGLIELRTSIAQWLITRFRLPTTAINPNKNILPVNGTREALFSFAQCIIDLQVKQPLVLMPNPFYQIYEGASILAGAKSYYINSLDSLNFQADFSQIPENVWKNCQLLYICSPNNPTGTVLDIATLQQLIEYANRYQFIIAADECYSEIYENETQPPVGLLQACTEMGQLDFKNCVVFHSLSKRSNVPGLRSGFVAGDAEVIQQFLLYRTYHGSAMSLVTQMASIAAWNDEKHVIENRILYRQKFNAMLDILSPVVVVEIPVAGFYLWLKTPIDDQVFASRLFAEQNVTVLPGSFLSRTVAGINPGENYVRIALVASLDECIMAAKRIREFIITV